MTEQSYPCRQPGCPNRYTDVAGRARLAAAQCLPCFYAEQLVTNAQTPEAIETAPMVVATFHRGLTAGGWTWQDVKDSYQRMRQGEA